MNKKHFSIIFIIVLVCYVVFNLYLAGFNKIEFKINYLTGSNHFTLIIPNGGYTIIIKKNDISYNDNQFGKYAVNINQIHKIEFDYQFDGSKNYYTFTNSNENEPINIDVKIESNYSFELYSLK